MRFVKTGSVTAIIFLGVKTKFVPVISQTIWAKLGAGDLHLIFWVMMGSIKTGAVKAYFS